MLLLLWQLTRCVIICYVSSLIWLYRPLRSLRCDYFLRWLCLEADCLLVCVTRESPAMAEDRLRPLEALSLPPLLLLPLPLSALADDDDEEDEEDVLLPPVLRGTGRRTER